MNENLKGKTILVTGASGMIGSATVKALLTAGYRVIGVDRREYERSSENYEHCVVDLSDKAALGRIVEECGVDRIIHLAALAHASGGKEYTWEDYKFLNVDCANNVFDAAGERPVLFISTVDVYGFARGTVNAQTQVRPVSHYAKSKVMAEQACQRLAHYTIFRFSPVYTDTIKRDIQKRYYLKYPNLAYRIGRGSEYEILNINGAVAAMLNWCESEPANDVHIIKDAVRMNTMDYIKAEKEQGRASCVLYFPRWMVTAGYAVLKGITGENKYTYLLHKAVCPIRSE